MKKKRMTFIIIIVLFLSSALLFCQESFSVSYGTTPDIDGIISQEEWNDAILLEFTGYNNVSITCYLKHNGTDSLYIAQDVPEMIGGDHGYIWLDTEFNQGSTPQNDDYWLSVYYFQDWLAYETCGTGNSWGNWIAPIDWNSDFTGDGWSYDHGQMEFAIAFSKMGIVAGAPQTIGFMIGFGDNPAQTDCWYFPSNGHYSNPNSWANMSSSDNWSEENNEVIEDLTITSDILRLENHPNPFNPTTTISFSLTTENTEDAELVIYNLKGQKVRIYSILNNQFSISWDGTDENNQPVSSGLYFYQLKVGKDFSETKRMLLLK
ncbi:MAG: T9SS type A sorting domain-containing protein [Candidatus Cloacimonetes bacterium]|nr:T9SS type A sorting domain-containing protein [Candidatus Cloacimonadota bacterium]